MPTLSARRDIIALELLASVQPGSKLSLRGTVEETDNDSGPWLRYWPGNLALASQVCSKWDGFRKPLQNTTRKMLIQQGTNGRF